MSEFTIPASQLIIDILESDDELDMKALDEPSEGGYWLQIGGDVNAWVHGGSWFNPAKRELLHFHGIDEDGIGEVQPDDVELPPEMLAKLPPEHEDWQENIERDRIIDNYRITKASILTDRLKRPFYVMDVPLDQLPHSWRKYDQEGPSGIDQETWQSWPIENKMDELASYFGWGEYSHEIRMNYPEAKKFLKGAL